MAYSKSRRNRTEVSCVIKYLVFGFNVIFWIMGAVFAGIGFWAWTEKDTFSNLSKLTEIPFDPALIFISVGVVMFLIGSFGCVGALRENTLFLLIYCCSIGLIFCLQLIIGILAFIYKDWVKTQIESQVRKMIKGYREDPDLQNVIDWVQKDWLKCCGLKDSSDWDENIYFSCSSNSSVESCGVPFSCCKPNNNSDLIDNTQCGYSTRSRETSSVVSGKIYSRGCLEAGELWLQENLIPVAGVAVGLALIQILGICFAQNLRSDIFAQMSKWH